MSRKRIRHIPDVARPRYTYCGRLWKTPLGQLLNVIDIARDCIDDAECRACQRSDDRRTREEYKQSAEYRAMKAERGG
jgi:hypothetical protein